MHRTLPMISRAKAKVIFESALNQKLQMEVTRLEEEFSARFEQ